MHIICDNGYKQNRKQHLYRNGVGVESNMDEAIKWYRLSAAQDYEQAVECLKELKEN